MCRRSCRRRCSPPATTRNSDPVDAHSVAMVALRTPNLVRVRLDADLQVMGMFADRRDELGRARTQTINRLHRGVAGVVAWWGEEVPVRDAGSQAGGHRQTSRPGG